MTSSTKTAWAATRKGLFELNRDAAGQWQIANLSFIAEPVTMLLPAPAGQRMLAALNLGHFGVKLHGSDDGGKTWRELAVPTFPAQPEGAQGPAWKLVQIWSLERGADGVIWAGTIPGALFRSSDQGESWQLVESLWHREERLEWFGGGYEAPGIHSVCPHPSSGRELLLGISCGGAWHSSDGGEAWATRSTGMKALFMPPERQDDPNIQDPHRIERCRAVPEVLWCQHHCGIWRSSDNGASWQELKAEPSSFGFAVAAHPLDAQTAWFVPAVKDERRLPVDAALCVLRTRDGGRTFETLRNGLPQLHCYDLVYRHGLTVDGTGQQLLMGSTTGGLWASGDAGDSWQTVSLNLPPIYAVRFSE
ncbi:sialidase family protein [Pelomonas sp. SE-A7]|uniref:WD40/YVTN/BNR-like repeat-containing protein n=1 Tax=Pelomonas sp. SE-A7 TaxID=3054953 RepID=UPI00259CAC3C|nr:sialidase family protein [Pelomonas sp. SE-A7]MDM4767220.1 exo-alpha-sialidase [Pelomonas sp. SE-A7]